MPLPIEARSSGFRPSGKRNPESPTQWLEYQDPFKMIGAIKEQLSVFPIIVSDGGIDMQMRIGVWPKSDTLGISLQRPTTYFPQNETDLRIDKEIHGLMKEMVERARDVAALETASEAIFLQNYPQLRRQIVPLNLKALLGRADIYSLLKKIESIENVHEIQMLPSTIVRQIKNHIIEVQAKGRKLDDREISSIIDTYTSLIGIDINPRDEPPRIKKNATGRRLNTGDVRLSSSGSRLRSRTNISPNPQPHRFQTRQLERVILPSASTALIASILLPQLTACAPGQGSNPQLIVTPTGIDTNLDKSQQITSPTAGAGVVSPEATPKPASPEATPSPNPPGKEVQYPSNASGFLWSDTDNSSAAINILEQEGSDYFAAVNAIEKFYKRVAENSGLDPAEADFVGSIGPDTWAIAMKYQGKYYTLKERDGLLISEITPFNIYNEPPENYELIDIKLDSLPLKSDGTKYTQNDIRIVQDNVSTYHVFATSDKKYYLDLTQDKWLPITANVEIIPTESVFNFEVGTWAENEDGTFNAQKMFPLVGAVDKKHHQTAPLTYNGLNIALVTEDDIAEKSTDERYQLIANQAVLINDNTELKNELDRINQAIVKLTQDTSKRWIKPEFFYVVIERNTESGLYQISQIVFDDFGEITRYKGVDQNSDFILLPKEEEPQLLPELYVGQIERTLEDGTVVIEPSFMKEGEPIRLTGAVVDHFIYGDYDLNTFKNDIKYLKDNLNGNFVSIMWNAGIMDQKYIDSLIEGVCFARSKGLRVELTLNSKGLEDDSNWYRKQLLTGNENLISDWEELLKRKLSDGSQVSRILAANVDIFSPLSEPLLRNRTNPDDNSDYITWSEWLEVAELVGNTIRQYVGQNKIIAISGVDFATDASGAVYNPPKTSNSIVEIHPYRWGANKHNFYNYIQRLKDKGMLPIIGEFGFEDDLATKEKQLKLFQQLNLSFAYFRISTMPRLEHGNDLSFGNESEKLVLSYFTGEDETD